MSGKIILVQCVTGVRPALAACVAAFLLRPGGQSSAIWPALAILLVMEFTDVLDGFLARRLGAVTNFGKIFDPYVDSVSRLTILWALSCAGRCWAIVPLFIAVRDIGVAYLRLHAQSQQQDVAARSWGKAKAVVHAFSCIALTAGPLYWGGAGAVIVAVGSVAVIGTGIMSTVDHVRRAWLLVRPGP